MIDIQLIGLFNATLQAATLLFIAALGELITEKSGILNLGVEGMISVGAVTGFMTAINTENIFLAVLVGVLSSSAFASIHALVTVILKQDQTVSGLILTILGLALSSLLGKNYVGKKHGINERPSNAFKCYFISHRGELKLNNVVQHCVRNSMGSTRDRQTGRGLNNKMSF